MNVQDTVAAQDLLNFGQRFAFVEQLVATRVQRILDPFGFTQPQLNVLTHLSRWPMGAPPLTVTSLADAVNITQPAATKMVSKFDSLGFVTFISSDQDKRVKRVRITPDGAQSAQAMQLALADDIRHWFVDWPSTDVAGFTQLLQRLGKTLDQHLPPH